MARIDIHHHVLTETYLDALAHFGTASVAGSAFPRWSLQGTFERMAELDIQRALLSISAPGLCFAPMAERPSLARDLNDEQAALRDSDPARVGMLASLPLPDIDASIAEITRVYEELHTDGVILLTNYDGVYLSDPQLAPVLAALNERSAVASVHPNVPGSLDSGMLLPPSLLEFTFDTTRVAADMIVRGTLQRSPNVTLVLAHLGGALPFLAWRLSMIEDRRRAPWADFADRSGSVRSELRRFYADTAMSAGSVQLQAAIDIMGADRLVYGSDTPFGPRRFVEKTGRVLAEESQLSEQQREAVDHATLAALLDRPLAQTA